MQGPHHTLILILFAMLCTSFQEVLWTQPSKAPSPGADDFLAGAYYYPWYAAPAQSEERGWMRQALRGRLTPRQLPALGVYSSRDTQVIGGS